MRPKFHAAVHEPKECALQPFPSSRRSRCSASGTSGTARASSASAVFEANVANGLSVTVNPVVCIARSRSAVTRTIRALPTGKTAYDQNEGFGGGTLTCSLEPHDFSGIYSTWRIADSGAPLREAGLRVSAPRSQRAGTFSRAASACRAAATLMIQHPPHLVRLTRVRESNGNHAATRSGRGPKGGSDRA